MEQAHPARRISAGLAALPGAGSAWAATQAAWRFFNNTSVTPTALAVPLRSAVRRALRDSGSEYVLAVVDWSKVDYSRHAAKSDRRGFCNRGEAGYALTTALAVDAAGGEPLGPLEVELESSAGTLTTRAEGKQPAVHPLEQIAPLMKASAGWSLPKRPVFVMDREYDSVEHFRAWHGAGHLFLVRADLARRVRWQGGPVLLKEVVARLRASGAFTATRVVTYRGRERTQYVAEAAVELDRPGMKHKANGDRRRVPGPPLGLRLVVAEVRDDSGAVLATWLLLTNVPGGVTAAELALWYYWRWRVETLFKLLKSAGVHIEEWQQETAEAILRRLLVACMACVTVWHLESRTDPAAVACKALLVRLSGRVMKRSRPVTTPALLAGLRMLLVLDDILGHLNIDEIRQIAQPILSYLKPP